MRKEIRAANVVFMVFTRIYRRRFDGEESEDTGLGATWESSIIENSLYAAAAGTSALKFIPITLSQKNNAYFPREVFSGTVYQLPKDWNRILKRLETLNPARGPVSPRRRHQKLTAAPLGLRARKDAPRAHRVLSVLFVGAEKGTNLDLRGQFAQTRAAIAKAKLGKSLVMRGLFDVTLDELLMELNERSPNVLHLSGRQEQGHVKMHNESGELAPVSANQLAELIKKYNRSLRLVILDTCGSLPQARRIARKVDCAIGPAGDVAEPVAIDFFAMFYNALATGASVHRAYALALGLELAKIEGNPRYRREMEEILEAKFDRRRHLPSIVARPGINLDKVFLAPTRTPSFASTWRG